MMSDRATNCPNCGTPAYGGGSTQTAYSNAGYSNAGYSNAGQSNAGYSNAGYSNAGYVTTSDTGYKSETTLKRTGDIAFIFFWIMGVLFAIVYIIIGIGMMAWSSPYGGGGSGMGLIMILFGLVSAAFPIFCAYAARAMAYTISNMSINLHEINMKTK